MHPIAADVFAVSDTAPQHQPHMAALVGTSALDIRPANDTLPAATCEQAEPLLVCANRSSRRQATDVLVFDECVPRSDVRAERQGELGPSSGSNRAWHILVGMARLLLASRGIPRLRELLQARGNQATLIPTASNPLADPTIADEVKDELAGAGLAVERIDLDEADAPGVRVALQSTDVLVVSGGDPFHLLQAARRISLADAAREALRAGAVYVGYSAGAMLAGPTLEPLRWTSPFPAPPALDLTGLGLADVLVLPHHDRAGRAERHTKAQMLFGDRVKLVPLRDGELVIQEGSRITVIHR